MAKQVKKTETAPTNNSLKSKKPRMPGINHLVDTPKGFRCHACKGLFRGVLHQKKPRMTIPAE